MKKAAISLLLIAAIVPHLSTASIPSADGTIAGCRAILGGALRVIDRDVGARCGLLEKSVSWQDSGGATSGVRLHYAAHAEMVTLTAQDLGSDVELGPSVSVTVQPGTILEIRLYGDGRICQDGNCGEIDGNTTTRDYYGGVSLTVDGVDFMGLAGIGQGTNGANEFDSLSRSANGFQDVVLPPGNHVLQLVYSLTSDSHSASQAPNVMHSGEFQLRNIQFWVRESSP
jgi:hypothetical protein